MAEPCKYSFDDSGIEIAVKWASESAVARNVTEKKRRKAAERDHVGNRQGESRVSGGYHQA